MVERNVDAMVEAIRNWELKAGEGFTDYFLDNWPVGSWAYWLLGKGHTEWANNIINANEKDRYVDQELKFEFYDDYASGDWSEEDYRKNVRVWAEFLVESDQYFRRVNKFFDEYFQPEADDDL
jgi:hypothetical protein